MEMYDSGFSVISLINCKLLANIPVRRAISIFGGEEGVCVLAGEFERYLCGCS